MTSFLKHWCLPLPWANSHSMQVAIPEEDAEKRPHHMVEHFVSAVSATLMRSWATSVFVPSPLIPPLYFLRGEKPGGNNKKQELEPVTNWGKDCFLFKISKKKPLTAKALIYRIDVSGHCVHVLGLRREGWHRDRCPSRHFPATQPTVISLHCRSEKGRMAQGWMSK